MIRPFAPLIALAALGCVNLSRPSVEVTDGAGFEPAAERPGDLGSDSEPEDLRPPDDSTDGGQPDPDADLGDGPTEVIPPDAPLADNGSPCQAGSQCTSGNCVRGVCCNSTCGEICQSCSVPGMLGSCASVPAGEDLGDHCARDPEATCQQDGTCDGQGGCRRYALDTLCAVGSCAAAVETAASTCDGNGTCRPGKTQSCAPNICMGASCGQVCTADGQCQTGFFCEAGKCAVKRAQAAPCATDNQCGSNFCVDKVCCASACTTMCFACNVPGAAGVCTAAPSGLDPRSQCPMQAADSCGRAGGCNGMGACLLHPNGTPCVAGSCTGTTETAARQCNGAGVCQPPSTRDCGPYLCGTTGSCATSCTSSAECQPGRPCAGGRCATIPDLALLWRFEEATGTIAVDDSGNGRNGTYTGASGAPAPALDTQPLQVPNVRSRIFSSASRHFVRLSPLPAALKPTSAVTMSVWYKATGTDEDGSELISGGNAYTLRLGPSQIEVSKRTSSAFVDCRVTVPGYLDGNWHHVAGVISATSFVIYFDGTGLIACGQTQPISYAIAGPDFVTGRHGDGQTVYDFGGQMDEVRIYTRALSSQEIAVLAAGGH